jgi:serine/threonine protein kinase
MDINSETRLLAGLNHPHICKLRATAIEPTFHQDYFIILDRLYEVLDSRLQVWQKRWQKYHGLFGRFYSLSKKKQLWFDQLSAGHGLASAIAYLHSKSIIHRDLKTVRVILFFLQSVKTMVK